MLPARELFVPLVIVFEKFPHRMPIDEDPIPATLDSINGSQQVSRLWTVLHSPADRLRPAHWARQMQQLWAPER